MEKLLLVGAGGCGRMVLEHACSDYECSFLDDGVSAGTMVCGAEVIGSINEIEKYYPEYKKLVVCIGNCKFREQVYKKAEAIGYEFPNIVCKSAYVSPFAKIGNGCILFNNVVIQNGSTIGDGVILNSGVEIHHDSVIGNNVLIYANSVIRTYVHVGNRSCLGSNLTVSNNVVVPEDTVVENGKTLFA